MGIDVNIDHRGVRALVSEQIEPIDGLEGCLGHPDGGGGDLGRPVIVLGAPAPASKARGAVAPLNVVDEVLNQGHLLHTGDNLQAGGDHLDEKEKIETDDIKLQETGQ